MWRMTPRLATATLIATVALALASAPQSQAAAVQSYSYSTSGSISNQAGVAPIYFDGAGLQSLTTPGTFSLGQFDAAATLPPTATLTYNNTPFNILMSVTSTGSPGASSGQFEYAISGVLNGSITGVGTSSMVATVTSITDLPIPFAFFGGTPPTPPFTASQLSIAPQGIIAPYTPTGTDGITTLYAQSSALGLPAPAPEPSTIAVFGVALAGWACHRRSRLRAKAGRVRA